MNKRNLNSRKPKKYFLQFHRTSAGSLGSARRKYTGQCATKTDLFGLINKAIEYYKDENFVPKHKFQDLNVDQRLIKSVVADKGYKNSALIQDQAISHIVNSFDVVGIADAGTGKTIAFLLPFIDKVLQNQKAKTLIITPARELAIQIDEEFKLFTKGMRVFSVCCIGGMGIGRQIFELRRNHNLIVGTPGRIRDLIERRIINLSLFNSVVLDEADRMLDMGLINDTRFIISSLPENHQTLFFSVTISKETERIVEEFTKNPVRVSVKKRDTSKNIDQNIIKIEQEKKPDVLGSPLVQNEFNKVLIFGRTKHRVEATSRTLIQDGIKAELMYGNKNNSQRQRALGMFKENRAQVLVATDVAARGLNIANISHAIDYDTTAVYDDYIHRIGRVGRWNKKGKALTFIE